MYVRVFMYNYIHLCPCVYQRTKDRDERSKIDSFYLVDDDDNNNNNQKVRI